MIANTGGALMAISQELAWNEQRVKIKFSFHESNYAKYRPGLLGDSYTESLFKDYNGQTYWLSGNISAFLSEKSGFPRWLNVAVGYGADGMTGARNNSVSETEGSFIADEARRRQYYLSPDIDLTRIPVKSKFLKSVFSVVGFIKIPAPSLEYDSNGNFKFHYLYF